MEMATGVSLLRTAHSLLTGRTIELSATYVYFLEVSCIWFLFKKTYTQLWRCYGFWKYTADAILFWEKNNLMFKWLKKTCKDNDQTYLSQGMWLSTMWYVGPAKAQTSLRIPTVWSEPLLVA